MMNLGWRSRLAISSSALALSLAISGGSQAQTPGEAQATNSVMVEEVIVTAQRRAESLQDVPIAMTAIGSGQLEAMGVDALEDIGSRSPGVFFKNLNVAQPQVFIRGIGTVQFDNSSEAPVGIFVDEVYIARHVAATAALFDLDRIEVLRGPQGTLYGRNTIGGAINVITQSPTSELAGQLEAEIGSYNAIRTRGFVSGPLGADLSGRVAFATNRREGWTRNVLLGNRANDEDNMAVRVKLAYEPSERFSLDLSADYVIDRAGAFEQELKGLQNLGIAPPQPDPSPNDAYLSAANTQGFQDRDVWGVAVKANYAITPGIDVTSITSYRGHEFDALRDLDVGPAPTLSAGEVEDGRQFSQEVRLASTGDERFNWLVGAYYFEEESTRTETWRLGGLVPIMPFILFQGDYIWSFSGDSKSYAAFSQVDYDLTDRFTLVAGLRYSHDEKSGQYFTGSTALFPLPSFIQPTPGSTGFTSRVSKSWSSLDPAVTLNFKASENAILYASYKQGFKSGGFQHRPASLTVSQIPFDPENLKATEVGFKTSWADHRLTLNLAAFHYAYDDLQQLDLIPNTIVTFTSNVAKAEVKGAELELVAKPVAGLDLQFAYSYLDAVYEDYVDSAGIQRRGNRLNRAPENTVNATVQYTRAVADAGDLTWRVEYVWRDEIFFNQDNAPVNHEPSVGLLNARVSFTTTDGAYTIAAAGSNLTEEVYCANQIVSVPSSTAASCVVGAPRQWSVSLKRRF